MTEDALLRAVADNPEDDAPRLIYADYLDEHGDPGRAEFIRVQCALARAGKGDPARLGLFLRQRELLGRHESEWLGPWRGLAFSGSFRRGFLEGVGLPLPALLEHGAPLLERTPVRQLRLTEVRDPLLARLLALPGLPRLERLDLDFNAVRDAGARALAGAPALAGLRTLKAGANPLTADGRGALAARFGDRVSFDCQPDEGRLYPFAPCDPRWRAGHLPDHRQAIVFEWGESMAALFFEAEGALLGMQQRPVPGGEALEGSELIRAQQAALDAWAAELLLRPGLVRVRRFELEPPDPPDPSYPAIAIADPSYWHYQGERGWDELASLPEDRLEEYVAWLWRMVVPKSVFELWDGEGLILDESGEVIESDV